MPLSWSSGQTPSPSLPRTGPSTSLPQSAERSNGPSPKSARPPQPGGPARGAGREGEGRRPHGHGHAVSSAEAGSPEHKCQQLCGADNSQGWGFSKTLSLKSCLLGHPGIRGAGRAARAGSSGRPLPPRPARRPETGAGEVASGTPPGSLSPGRLPSWLPAASQSLWASASPGGSGSRPQPRFPRQGLLGARPAPSTPAAASAPREAAGPVQASKSSTWASHRQHRI